MSEVIEFKNVSIPKATAEESFHVQGIHLSVSHGQSFGFVGPKNSGKKEILKTIFGFIPISQGRVSILDRDPLKDALYLKSKLGLYSEAFPFDPSLTPAEQLKYFGRFQGLRRSEIESRFQELVSLLDLEGLIYKSTWELSTFELRKFLLARALIHRPQVLALDEPTKGLSMDCARELWEVLKLIKPQLMGLVISTSNLVEAQLLSDEIILMDRGKEIAKGTPSEMIHSHVGRDVLEFPFKDKEASYHLSRLQNQFQYQVINNQIRVFIGEEVSAREAMTQISAENIQLRQAGLEDVFEKLAGYQIEGEVEL